MSHDFKREVRELEPGDHLSLLYQDREQRLAGLALLVREALRRGHRCRYLTDPEHGGHIEEALSAEGISVAEARDSGRLEIYSSRDAFMGDGAFDPEGAETVLEEDLARALEDGFETLWWISDTTWLLGECRSDDVKAMEAHTQRVVRDRAMIVVCQYDRAKLDEEAVSEVLTAHPLAILGDEVFPNPYYLPPEAILDEAELTRSEWMIRGLERQGEVRSRLESRERQLQTLLENSPDLIVRMDRSHRYLYANPAAERLTGIPAEERLGRKHEEVFPDLEATRPWIDAIDRVFETGEPRTVEAPFDTPGGERWFETRVVPEDGEDDVDGEGDAGATHEVEHPRTVLVVARDITDRVRAEQERRRFEELYRDFFHLSRDGIFISTMDGEIVDMNAAALEIVAGEEADDLDRSTLRRELVETNARDLYADPARREELLRALEEGPVQDFPVRIRRPDGTPVEIVLTAIPWRNDRSEMVGMKGMIRDVTEEKRAQDRLRESEARFRQIAEHVEDVFWITTPGKDEMLYLSPAFEKIWGRSREVVYQNRRAWMDAVHPEDQERVKAALPLQIRGEYDIEYRIVDPEGRIRWIHDRAFPIRDEEGEIQRIVGVAEDFTEKKQAAEELRRAEERYRSLVENSGDVISVVTAGGIVQSTTPSAEEVFGISPDEMEGTSALSRVHPDDRDRIGRRLAELADEPGGTATESYRILDDAGRVRHVESIASNLLHDPAVQGIVINTRDVTEHKELEEQLRQSQKMEAIGRLAGGVAHDFNNLLTVIEGRADFLQGDLPDGSPLREDAEEIRRAADRAAALTRQLLAFGKRQILQPEILDLNDAVLDMEQMLQRIIGEDVDLVVEPGRRSLGIEVDPAQLQQVILNLVINAREAMPDGGRIVLRLGRSPEPGGPLGPREVETTDNGPRGFCTLTVEDTGQGIPEEILDRIFDPFFTTKDTGTGIGLSTVFGIVEQSGGHIEVDSPPGKRTTFAVHFPRVEVESSSESEIEESAEEVGGGETVLLVEDDEAIRSVVVRTLEKKGYTVLAAASAEEAVELVDDVIPPPDLLLSDVVMPGMDGPDLAQILTGRIPRIRVLFMSGYSEDMAMATGGSDARVEFIGKPFMPDELSRKVREVLDAGGG